MDAFLRCVQDLAAIDRLLELPHGHDIALEMYRESMPYLLELQALRERDPSGAAARICDYADDLRKRLGITRIESTPPRSNGMPHHGRVA